MLGAIIGDIVGSRFEFNNKKSKDFELFTYDCEYTDDSLMTLAVSCAVAESKNDLTKLGELATKFMRRLAWKYPFPMGGYGGMFNRWLFSESPKPYNSYGNGSAMRVSACGWAGQSVEQTVELSRAVTEITHNHPEGIKGAEATAVAIYLARTGEAKEDIKRYVASNYYAELNDKDFTVDKIRPNYSFDGSCQGTVPQALQCFFDSTDFIDAIRNAISIGGDSDTIGAITGAVAEAYYGIPEDIKDQAMTYLNKDLKDVLSICQKKLDIKL